LWRRKTPTAIFVAGGTKDVWEKFPTTTVDDPDFERLIIDAIHIGVNYMRLERETETGIMMLFCIKKRNIIELMFGKMKHFRGIVTRYNKTAIRFWVLCSS
jgi:hypothetical protein